MNHFKSIFAKQELDQVNTNFGGLLKYRVPRNVVENMVMLVSL